VSVLLQTALLFVQVAFQTSMTRATIPALCAGIVGFVILLVLSHFEHTRSIRGSTVLLLYLNITTPMDAMRARTLWSMPNNVLVSAIFTAFAACKLVLSLLEHVPKTVQPGVRQPTPDEQADIMSRSFIWWLNPLFSVGKKKSTLTAEALPDIENALTCLGKVPNRAEGGKPYDSSTLNGPTIFHHLLAARGGLLMSAVVPRLAYTGFTYAQPFLVQRATEYMSEPSGPNTYNIGGGLIAAYVIVYVGIAVSNTPDTFFAEVAPEILTTGTFR
jgi:hypothetical protein